MLRCPQCDSNGDFIISTEGSLVVNKFAHIQEVREPDTKWYPESDCECIECGYVSTVSEFNFTDFYYGED